MKPRPARRRVIPGWRSSEWRSPPIGNRLDGVAPPLDVSAALLICSSLPPLPSQTPKRPSPAPLRSIAGAAAARNRATAIWMQDSTRSKGPMLYRGCPPMNITSVGGFAILVQRDSIRAQEDHDGRPTRRARRPGAGAWSDRYPRSVAGGSIRSVTVTVSPGYPGWARLSVTDEGPGRGVGPGPRPDARRGGLMDPAPGPAPVVERTGV